jgi:hypothetical protein
MLDAKTSDYRSSVASVNAVANNSKSLSASPVQRDLK